MTFRWFPTDQINHKEARNVPQHTEFQYFWGTVAGIRSDARVGTFVGKGTFITYQPQSRITLARCSGWPVAQAHCYRTAGAPLARRGCPRLPEWGWCGMSETIPPESQARAFLKMIDPEANSFCFRKLRDNDASRVRPENLDGQLKQVLPQLQRASRAGGGAFVVVNEGGQKDDDITRVRAVFADTDGAPVEPIIDALTPHIVVETSPKKYHVYWLVADFPLDQFKPVQLAIATQFGTDESVTNLSRVMRMPGFHHNKNEPFLSRLIAWDSGLPRYKLDEVVTGLDLQLTPPDEDRQPSEWSRTGKSDAPPIAEVEKALTYLNPFVIRGRWVRNILALAHDYGEDGRDLAHRWSRGDLWSGERHGA
jgi:hypothetical protein